MSRKKDREYYRQLYRRRNNRNVITHENRKRLIGGFAALLILMFALIFRMGYWQIVRADDLKLMAADIQKVDTEIEPVRGSILDSNGSTLAETVTEFELYAYTQYIYKADTVSDAEKKAAIRDMADITGVSRKKIRERFSSDENLVLIASGLTKEQVEEARKKWDSNIQVRTKDVRYYPNGAFAAQILGGVNSENVGRSGLEYQYNSVLSGVKGRTLRTTDRDGNTISGGKSRRYDAQDGMTIKTTVDSVIQNFTEEALATGMKKTGAEAITCIVMNPKTGDVLAMASTPDYDPNNSGEPTDSSERKAFEKMTGEEQSEYLSKMWTVKGISNVYEPGSTFKLITAAAALESATARVNSKYSCTGSIHVGNYDLRCLGVHGEQTLKEAVGHSCNPALARAALDMGAGTFYNYIDLFGFNDPTGIDLPGETNSIVKSADGMGEVDLATTGYGQGIAVTPLQILCAVNSFGNGGVLMKPKLVSRILNSSGEVVETVEDTAVRQVVSESTAKKMCDIMEYYVSDAGGSGAYVPGYRIGGKTGTANLVDGSTYSKFSTNTSFVAMAPMDDPQISMICIVYKPTKAQYGNYTAGPIVREVMEKSLSYLGVERKYSRDEEAYAKKEMTAVPDVTGISSKEAIRKLKEKGLTYKVEPEPVDDRNFYVRDQLPKAGTKVDKKTTPVYLYSE